MRTSKISLTVSKESKVKKCLWVAFTFFLATICHCDQPLFSGKIFVIGDSHQLALSEVSQLPIVDGGLYHPNSMYAINRSKGSTLAEGLSLVGPSDAIIFTFGFVDVNWYMWKQVHTKNRCLDEIIETLVCNFMDIVQDIKPDSPIKIIYNMTPPAAHCNPPCKGPVEERVIYTKKMNEVLARECALRKLEFLDVYDNYCDERGELLDALSDGNQHIHPSCNKAIMEKISEILQKYPRTAL